MKEAQEKTDDSEKKLASQAVIEANQVEAESRYEAKKKHNLDDDSRCFACGWTSHRKGSEKCLAKNRKCNRCGKIGHFEKRCHSSKRKAIENDVKEKAPPGKKTKTKNEANWIVADDEDPYNVFCFEGNEADIECVLAEVPIEMLIDSGADVNIINYDHWEEIREKRGKVWNAIAGNGGKVLKAYGTSNSLNVKGTFMTAIKIGGKEVEARVFVVEGGQRALLSRGTAKELGV